jgi:hypothetical protein
MIFASGAGAMQDAARAMRKLHNQWTKSGDGGRRRSSLTAGYEPESVGYPCAELCGSCGYFVDIDPDPESDVEPTCPACGDQAWIDLEIEPVASAIREMEAEERNEVPTWIKSTVVVATFAAIAAGVGALYAAGVGAGYTICAACSALLFVPAAYFGLSKPASVLLLQGRARFPDRWHVPLPLPEEERAPSQTFDRLEARIDDELVTAPISDRECIACQICVLFDASGDARPAEWALEEQSATTLVFDGAGPEGELRIGPEELYLETPVEFVHATGEDILPVDDDQMPIGAGVDYDTIKRFLRERGLFITEGDFHFYEAVLQPGDRVDVTDYDGDIYIVEHSEGPRDVDVPELTDSLES